jgi:type III pantothenate kinase
MTGLVAVGIGNTSLKLGIRNRGGQATHAVWDHLCESETSAFDPGAVLHQLPGLPCRWRVASVHRPAERDLRAWQQSQRPHDDYSVLTPSDLPLEIDVEHPQRVGMDRLVAAVAVNGRRARDLPAIIVDAGTAITVDLVDERGVFRGGVILPGFRMIARALAEGTDLLPNVDATFRGDAPTVVGRSTEEAIRSGLFWGGLGSIRELLGRISAQLSTLPQIFVTGGDAERLTPYLDKDAEFVSDLVLMGIVIAAHAESDEPIAE